jgi:hypothetical protein
MENSGQAASGRVLHQGGHSPQHLHRYLAEFDFRYNEHAKLGVNDRERTSKLLLQG